MPDTHEENDGSVTRIGMKIHDSRHATLPQAAEVVQWQIDEPQV